jgi:uncharacterized protein with HEPN domain
MGRESKDWLEDILRAIMDIEDFVQGFDKATFLTIPETDRRTFLALTSAIMQIGEAIKSLSPELKARHPQVDWRSAIRTRDLLAHHYDRINIDIIWDIVSNDDLKLLKAVVKAELA